MNFVDGNDFRRVKESVFFFSGLEISSTISVDPNDYLADICDILNEALESKLAFHGTTKAATAIVSRKTATPRKPPRTS